MTIRFTASPADMGAYHDWYYRHMPEAKKMIQRSIFRGSALILLLCGMAAWLNPHIATYVFLEAIIGIIAMSVLLPKRLRSNASRQAVRLYEAESNTVLFGQRSLEINADGLLSVSESASGLYQWKAFKQIIVDENHAYLMVGSVAGIVIPRATISEGNFDAFIAEAKRLHAQATQPTAVPLGAR